MSDYLGGDLGDGSAPQPTDGLGEHALVSRLTGATTTVAVRKKLVDARYLEPVIPLNHTPSFEIDPDAMFIPVNGLAKMAEAANGYTIVGSGKTAIDACLWLLENGVDPKPYSMDQTAGLMAARPDGIPAAQAGHESRRGLLTGDRSVR
jgi:hypothetical protein